MSITIRTANSSDIGPIAETIYSSGPDVYDYLYSDQALDFIRFEFSNGGGFAGHRNVTVALDHDEVIATGCFYGIDSFKTLVQGTIENALQFFGDKADHVLKRSATMAEVIIPPAEGELYLSNFGVMPGRRSQGIGSRMIEHKLSQAKQQGFSVFGLDVSVENSRAQNLYENLGLSVRSEKCFSVENSGVKNSRKMEMLLQ